MEQERNAQQWDTDVLIVGAGPVGVTLACALMARGVQCRLIEQREEPYTIVRAHALQPRTMELFDRMGIIERVLRQGREVPPWYLYDGDRRIGEMAFAPLKHEPYPAMWFIQQPTVERLLREHLQELGGTVEYRQQLVQLRQEEDGVIATVATPDTTTEVRAHYVVGCDGGRSTTRHLLGLPFEGKTLPGLMLIAEVDMDWDRSRDGAAHIWVHADGLFSATFIEEVGKWQLVVAAPKMSQEQETEPSLALFQHLFEQRTGEAHTRMSNPSWMSMFVLNQRLATHYRMERVFLAGDAAHIHSPAGGLGMNTGIQDAYNLAWKLALVLEGKATPSLLDTYEQERRPIGEALLRDTETNTGVLLGGNAALRLLRDRLVLPLMGLPLLQRKATQRGAQLDLTYRTSSLSRSDDTTAQEPLFSSEHLRTQWDRLAFRSAPQAGDRAPDIAYLRTAEQHATSLFQQMRGTRWHLLLFGGEVSERSKSTILTLLDEAQHVKMHLGSVGEEIKPLLILNSGLPIQGLDESIEILFDPEGEAHRRYGARGQALYLVRPDGYIGFRSLLPGEETLLDYLDSIFVRTRTH
ncbi:FAD-dependent monooxygenase [Ktedonospora formicarum]|uniref:3-(3-hydroxyphenyl)propionate hydroxylase n=1 Tax=Ktedonospora formicarum TaxID=2778364 RepID=A0A8J3I576_9CHLR|nr:FAD-dependent monooxygenase [Ktedonospora formicarum]GHO50537.1 3-(3-hydroxyphenyl)propionate hydroxylase [Ktedonospora formicarum]